jgi:hypothetical protein
MNDAKPEYHSTRLQLSCFLIATDRLLFSHLEQSADGRFRFIFLDPERIGPQIAMDFERGATRVDPRNLFAAQSYLRRAMSNFQASPVSGKKSTLPFTEKGNEHIDQQSR